MNDSLGEAIRRHRESRGLTQESLAQLARISTRAVGDIERGLRRRIYPDTASGIANALSLDGPTRNDFLRLARGRPGSLLRLVGELPMPLTPLVAREAEVRRLVALLEQKQVRLVTVTGPGGVGKTRVAIAASAAVASSYPDGVAWVELASCAAPDAVGLAIATVVGSNPRHGSVADLVRTSIGDRRILVVLETFEHVLDAAALVAEVVARCPNVTFLTTSRAPLRIQGEHVLLVEPLIVSAAAVLFLDRASAVRPDLDAPNAVAIAEDICGRVQGLPLAVELAAARARHVSLMVLSEQLDSQLAVLTVGDRDQPVRQRTMRDTVAWSHDLLDSSARTAFAKLSVLDGWNLEAAARVVEADVLAPLSTLVEHSLVRPPSPSDAHGRYAMLDVVREYAAHQRPRIDGAVELSDRHAGWFLEVAEAAAPAMRGRGQQAAHREVAADLGNMRVAFGWLRDDGRALDALRLSAALWMFWLWQGGFAEGRSWLRAALYADTGREPQVTATALWGASWLAYFQGDYAEARVRTAALRSLAERTGSSVSRRNAVTMRGMLAMAERRFADAAAALDEALELAGNAGDPWLRATSTLNAGAGVLYTGDVSRARRLFDIASHSFSELGDETYTTRAQRHLAACNLVAGNHAQAQTHLLASLHTSDLLDDRWGVAESVEGLAQVAASLGDVRRAAVLASYAARVRQRLGVVRHPFDEELARRFLSRVDGTPGWDTAWADATASLHDLADELGIVP